MGFKVRTCCCFCKKKKKKRSGFRGGQPSITDFHGCSEGNVSGFSHAYNVARCSQNEMRARGQGNTQMSNLNSRLQILDL